MSVGAGIVQHMEATLDALAAVLDVAADADRAANIALAARTRAIAATLEWEELAIAESREAGQRSVGGWDARVRAKRTVSHSLGIVLMIPERTAEAIVEASRFAVASTPGIMSLFDEGALSFRHIQVVAEQGYRLPEPARAEYDAQLAAVAADLTVAQLRDRARRIADRLHPTPLAERHEIAQEQRRVEVEAAEDGMAWLSAFLPAHRALGIHARLTDTARAVQRANPDDSRTLAQLRADAFTDLLLDGEVAGSRVELISDEEGGVFACDPFPMMSETDWPMGIRPRVHVTVPVQTLLGTEELPATLAGYGPIAPDVARELTANAPSLYRILTHPETGTILSVGRDRYAVPPDLRAWLQLRDETCRTPGCREPAMGSEIDHTDDFARGGSTSHDNLAHLCRKCHRLKHQLAVGLEQLGGGVMRWTAPTGHSRVTYPAESIPAPAAR